MSQISVIMTNYNQDKFIKQAVESVLNQTLIDYELLIVDDASTDSSRTILMELEEKDSRIKLLFNGTNMGPSYSRNRALKISTGQYICFVDSDDLIKAERLEKMLHAIAARPNYIAYTYVSLIDGNGNPLGEISPNSRNFPPQGEARDYILKEWIWAPSTFMIPFSAIREVGYFDESIRWGEDLEYLIRLTKMYKVAVIREPLYIYRLHGNSVTGSMNSISKDKATIRILETVLKRDWNNLSDLTKYWIIVRILRTRRVSHIRGKLKWLLNPFFIRTSLHSQPVFNIFIRTIMEDFGEAYHKVCSLRI